VVSGRAQPDVPLIDSFANLASLGPDNQPIARPPLRLLVHFAPKRAFRVSGSGFRAQGSGFRVQGSGHRG
jgi:hypothetical protein